MKLTQDVMNRINAIVTQTIAKELDIKEKDVPDWLTVAWMVGEDGISRYFVAGDIGDDSLAEVGPILLDMCDQLANMGHLPKIKLHRDGDKFIEGRHEYDKKKCDGCSNGDKRFEDEPAHPWSNIDKKKWN